MSISDHHFVFVIGMHRSGTTMLGNLIANHSGASGLTDTSVNMNEGSHIQTAIPLPPGLGSLAFKRHSRHTETSPYATRAVAQSLWRSWSPYWDTSKPVLVEKSPNHIMSTRLLQKLFPNSSFVCIMRHPIAQALAISKWATNRSLLQFIANWTICHERLIGDLPHLRHKIIFRYEDFCAAPEAHIQQALKLIGLPDEPVFDRPIHSSNQRYFDRWQAGGTGLSARAQRIAARAFLAPRFARFGYHLSAPFVTKPRFAFSGLESTESTVSADSGVGGGEMRDLIGMRLDEGRTAGDPADIGSKAR